MRKQSELAVALVSNAIEPVAAQWHSVKRRSEPLQRGFDFVMDRDPPERYFAAASQRSESSNEPRLMF